MNKPKNYKWQKNDGIETMALHLKSEHGLGSKGEERSSGSGQAQLHGYDHARWSFGESPNYKYFNRVALQPQNRKLLHDAIVYHDVLTDIYNESRTDGRFITNDHWSLAMIIHDVLQTFDNPNIHMVILKCIKIIHSIRQTSEANPDASVKNVLDNMKGKWHTYFNEFPHIYGIVVIIDLGVKVEDYVNFYGAVIQPEPVNSSKGKSRFGFLGPVLKK
ncbi:Type-2 restriction enzyme BsuMI component YdjA [Bienertia sinuspersici]